jgi:hypothetical protein
MEGLSGGIIVAINTTNSTFMFWMVLGLACTVAHVSHRVYLSVRLSVYFYVVIGSIHAV